MMYGLSLSVSTVQTNYKGRSPIREVEPQRITHFPANIYVPICVVTAKSRLQIQEGAEIIIGGISNLLKP